MRASTFVGLLLLAACDGVSDDAASLELDAGAGSPGPIRPVVIVEADETTGVTEDLLESELSSAKAKASEATSTSGDAGRAPPLPTAATKPANKQHEQHKQNHTQVAPAPLAPEPSASASARECCRVCRKGKACGDTCVSRDRSCSAGPGCACDG